MSGVKKFRTCSIPNCNRPHEAHGLCNAHYKRERVKKGLRRYKPKTPKKTIKEKFWEHVDCNGPVYKNLEQCWVWTGLTRSGYGVIGGKGTHRISWELHNGPINDKLHILHYCDNRPCVNPKHLFLGTTQDNTIDMIKKNRQFSKLTTDIVKIIRDIYIPHDHIYGAVALARKYNVSQYAIRDILDYTTWKHVN